MALAPPMEGQLSGGESSHETLGVGIVGGLMCRARADNRCHVLQNLRANQGSAGGTRVKDGEEAGLGEGVAGVIKVYLTRPAGSWERPTISARNYH